MLDGFTNIGQDVATWASYGKERSMIIEKKLTLNFTVTVRWLYRLFYPQETFSLVGFTLRDFAMVNIFNSVNYRWLLKLSFYCWNCTLYLFLCKAEIFAKIFYEIIIYFLNCASPNVIAECKIWIEFANSNSGSKFY